MKTELFYELVRVALGNQKCLSKTPTEEEWGLLFAMAEKQAVDGITYEALTVLAKQGQRPPEDILLDWFSYAEQVKEQNRIVNRRCEEVTELFAKAGFKTCILKGQGNGLMYGGRCLKDDGRCKMYDGRGKEDEQLGMLRVPGDIDIWVDGSRKEIRDFVVARCPDAQDGDMHIQFPIFDDVPVEVHYKPRYSPVPKYNKRLQRWFGEQAEEQFSHVVSLPGSTVMNVCVPTVSFNVVHQMSHMMGHLFVEGIGLRQLVDYYFLLRYMVEDGRGMKEDVAETFEYLGMLKFARGVMWIEKELLGLDGRYLIAEPSEKIGRLIQKEIEEGGNFGHYDERYNMIREKGLLARGLVDIYRLVCLMHYFPADTFWKIINKIENQRWKLKNLKSFQYKEL